MTTISAYEDFEQWDKILELVKTDQKLIHDLEYWFVFSRAVSYIIDGNSDKLNMVDELLNYCISIGYKPINIPQAAYFGDINSISTFLAQGNDIDETEFREMTALMIAVLRENHELVKFLLERNACNYSEDYENNKAIDFAKKDTEIFTLLKSSGVMTREEVNDAMCDYASAMDFANDFRDTQIEFMTGAEKGDIEQMKKALNRPNGIRVLNGTYPVNGKTALHLATEKNRIEAVKFLLEKGLDKNKTDLKGETPIQIARRLNYAVIEKLMNAN